MKLVMFFVAVVVACCGMLLTSCTSVRSNRSEPAPSFVQTGKMSYYSVWTNHGTSTASGERLSTNASTAAHRTLPFGTMVKVTNLQNGRSEVVRINDRGPFVSGRIIDVTKGVAKKLDFVKSGVVPVRIEVVD